MINIITNARWNSSECIKTFYSVTYRFQYREPTRTLKTEEIDAAHQKVLEGLKKGLGVNFR